MMIDIILQIMILTAFLTLCGGAMLIFRCFCVEGGGRVLKRMWIIVLLLAFIPMYLLPITLPNRLRQQMVPTDWHIVDGQTVAEQWAAQREENSELPATHHETVGSEPTSGIESDASTLVHVLTEHNVRARLHITQGVILGIWVVGALSFIAKYQYDKHRLAQGLQRFAVPCRDESLDILLRDCAKQVGVKRRICLMLIGDDLPPMSPFLVGYCRPKLYIHASHINDSLQTEEIFVHELHHLHSMDMFYKNFTCVVLALHWFNPITYWIMPRIFEDCELSCDHRTLKTLGEERRFSYMKTILNIAATVQPPKRAGYAAQFFCEPSGKQTMKHRYRGLAGRRLRPAARILALCLVVLMVFSCVGCQLIGKKKNTLHLLTPLTEEMVRFYYDLSPEDEITQEMLDGVTSLFVYRDMTIINAIKNFEREEWYPDIPVTEEYPFEGQRYSIEELGEFTILNFEVNYADTENSFAAYRNQGDPLHIQGCMDYIPKNYMNTVMLATVEKGFGDGAYQEKHQNADGEVSYRILEGEYLYKQFKAYWMLKDYNLLTSERQKKEILEAFPGCDEYPYYVFDPTASTAELMRMYVRMGHVGLLENRILDDGTIDPDIFKVFPNLIDLHIVGIPQA